MCQNKLVVTYCELDYLKEDLFQGDYKNLTLDIGYYGELGLKLRVIKDEDWDNPLEQVTFFDANLIKKFIEIFKDRLEQGYYDGKYILNEGYTKEL